MHATSEKNRFNLLVQLGAVIQQFPQLPLSEALSSGQVASKRWLIEELEKIDRPLGLVYVLGGWWGLLPAMMFESRLQIQKIRSFDIDSACAPVADTINRRYVMDEWKFKATTADMLAIDYRHHAYRTTRANGSEVTLEEKPDTIVNTSCEHVQDFAAWWGQVPAGMMMVLQSNDFRSHPQHVNCVASLEEFAEQCPLRETFFRGSLELPDYSRFMLIGIK